MLLIASIIVSGQHVHHFAKRTIVRFIPLLIADKCILQLFIVILQQYITIHAYYWSGLYQNDDINIPNFVSLYFVEVIEGDRFESRRLFVKFGFARCNVTV